VSKVEITIPPQFSEAIEKAAEKEGITADELTERAMKEFLERSNENVRS
jgi:LDH2 family malate/lactate/ureidoglycolate dehydrogenase